jgi:hypothetical protein
VSALLALVLCAPPVWARGIEQNEPPLISHVPPGMAYIGQPVPIYARVTDQTGKVKKVKLFYALSQQQAPVEVPMKRIARDRYQGLIPANFFVGMSKVWYYIEARDSYDDKAESTWYPVVIKDPSQEIVEEQAAEQAAASSKAATTSTKAAVRTATPASTSSPVPASGAAGPAGVAFPPGAASAAGGAGGGGIGVGTVIGVVLVGGVAVAAASGSSGGGGGGGGGSVTPCNETTVPGGDTAETHTFGLGQTSGSFVFDWDTFFQPDRIVVRYEGGVLFDSGCVGGSGSENLAFDGGSSEVTVEVTPNCAGGSGTSWEFTVRCP